MEIVGVVADSRWQDPSRPSPPVIYAASAQGLGGSLSILARTSLDEATLAATLRTLLHDAIPPCPSGSRAWRSCSRTLSPIRGSGPG